MRWGAAFFGLWVACAAEPMTDDAGSASPDLGHLEPEAGVTDAFEDAEISDAGEIDAEDARVDDADSTPHDAGPDAAFEPCGPPGGACERAADCQPDLPPPTNCETCVRYNRSLCASGACRAPPILDGTDLYNVVVTLAPGLPPLESFSTFAIAAATAGGAPLRCQDLRDNPDLLNNTCLNVLESRAYTLGQSGQSFAVGFVGFPGGERTLFLIRGHTEVQARGAPVASSCTEVDVGLPSGQGPYFIAGETLGN